MKTNFTELDFLEKKVGITPKSTIHELFKAKSTDPRTYSPPSLNLQNGLA